MIFYVDDTLKLQYLGYSGLSTLLEIIPLFLFTLITMDNRKFSLTYEVQTVFPSDGMVYAHLQNFGILL